MTKLMTNSDINDDWLKRSIRPISEELLKKMGGAFPEYSIEAIEEALRRGHKLSKIWFDDADESGYHPVTVFLTYTMTDPAPLGLRNTQIGDAFISYLQEQFPAVSRFKFSGMDFPTWYVKRKSIRRKSPQPT